MRKRKRTRPQAAAYEVVVLGCPGPAVRHALRREAGVQVGDELVLRTVVHGPPDLVELVRALEGRDLRVTEVTQLG